MEFWKEHFSTKADAILLVLILPTATSPCQAGKTLKMNESLAASISRNLNSSKLRHVMYEGCTKVKPPTHQSHPSF